MKILVLLMSLAAFLLVTLPGPLYRYGLVELGTAFAGFKYAVITGFAALILLIVQVLLKRQIALYGLGLRMILSYVCLTKAASV